MRPTSPTTPRHRPTRHEPPGSREGEFVRYRYAGPGYFEERAFAAEPRQASPADVQAEVLLDYALAAIVVKLVKGSPSFWLRPPSARRLWF